MSSQVRAVKDEEETAGADDEQQGEVEDSGLSSHDKAAAAEELIFAGKHFPLALKSGHVLALLKEAGCGLFTIKLNNAGISLWWNIAHSDVDFHKASGA